MKKLFFILVVISFMPLMLSASGTSSANFLKIIPSAKVKGCADSLGVFGDDIGTSKLNPAILAELSYPQLFGMHIFGFSDSYYEFLGVGFPTKYGVFNASFFYFHTGEFKHYNSSGEVIGFISEKGISATIGYGNNILKTSFFQLIGGLNINYIYQKVADIVGNTFAGDIGLIFKTDILKFYKKHEQNMFLSASVRNLGGKIKGTSLPMALQFGFGYRFIEYAGLFNEIVLYRDEELQDNIGLELNYKFFTVRAGKIFSNERNSFSLGGGVDIKYENTVYMLDYSLISIKAVDTINHCISLSVSLD